jgi:prepilin-type N-terminal cleavage/methylation domain-containing protein
MRGAGDAYAAVTAGSNGFSLIELLVVISIIAILFVALGFSFIGWRAKYEAESDIKRIHVDLSNARVRAMQTKHTHFVNIPSGETRKYFVYSDNDPAPDGNGILDTSNDQKIVEEETKYVIVPEIRHFGFNRSGIAFHSGGMITSGKFIHIEHRAHVNKDKPRVMEQHNERMRGAMKAHDTGGFSIVELIVAMVLLLFVALAMMQTALVSTDTNARNVLRDEGVRLASRTLDELRYEPFDDLMPVFNGSSKDVDIKLRNMEVRYTVSNTVVEVTSGTSRIDVQVEWSWRGELYNTSVSTLRGE